MRDAAFLPPLAAGESLQNLEIELLPNPVHTNTQNRNEILLTLNAVGRGGELGRQSSSNVDECHDTSDVNSLEWIGGH